MIDGDSDSMPVPTPPLPGPDTADAGIDFVLETEAAAAFVDFLDEQDWTSGRTKHNQTYDAFLRAASLGIDPEFAFALVLNRVEATGGVVDVYQVRRQQRRAFAFVTGEASADAIVRAKPPRVVFSPESLARVAASLASIDPIEFLRARSAVPPAAVSPTMYLDLIYATREKVLVFTNMHSQGDALYVTGVARPQVVPQLGPEGVWYLAQPVDGRYHQNAEGKRSRRSEPSVTAWRYLVLESDVADADDWLRAVIQMPLAIVAIYTSGGRSIHCLVRVEAASKAAWDEFRDAIKPIVVTLGADPAAMTGVRLTRLPGCWRAGKKQELLFLNPTADGTPIIHLPAKRSITQEAEKQ